VLDDAAVVVVVVVAVTVVVVVEVTATTIGATPTPVDDVAPAPVPAHVAVGPGVRGTRPGVPGALSFYAFCCPPEAACHGGLEGSKGVERGRKRRGEGEEVVTKLNNDTCTGTFLHLAFPG
jgi:hypothetical protein